MRRNTLGRLTLLPDSLRPGAGLLAEAPAADGLDDMVAGTRTRMNGYGGVERSRKGSKCTVWATLSVSIRWWCVVVEHRFDYGRRGVPSPRRCERCSSFISDSLFSLSSPSSSSLALTD
jgi:hypothetical protein